MKKLVLLALAFCSMALAVDPRVSNMVAQCSQVMAAGNCRVVLDPNDYPNETILISGVGRIKTAAYLRIRGLADAKNPDGTFKMCTAVHDFCTADWSSDECQAARALWRQTPP